MLLDPPRIDFIDGALGHRLRGGAGRGGSLARAIGVKPDRPPDVVDATAGLGRDGFILASLGCRVTMIERAPAIHAALATALQAAAKAAPEIAAAAARITLLQGDAIALLARLAPAIVFLDPMHPDRGNTALVRQELRQLRAIVGNDADAPALIAFALDAATSRVVLKWPRQAPLPPGLPRPSHCIAGRTTRYEVFLCHPTPPMIPASGSAPA
jgi:16S rRNA (guanine1516-N2)-methyltransferase